MWYNDKDVVPTLEAMQKMIELYHQKEIDMLKLGCTLRNLANICLHKFTDSYFYPFTESDKDLLVNNQCLLDCIQSGAMTLDLKNSFFDRTKHAFWKKWSFLVFNKLVRNVRLKALLQLVDK